MKKFAKLSCAGVFALCAATTAFAQEDSGNDLNPWQDCGIGAMVFPDNQTAAAISNVIWDLGSTAVTSKTMSPESCEGDNAKTALYIRMNYARLETEIAQGQGEYLLGMTDVMSCGEQAKAQLIAHTRQEMATRMSQATFASASDAERAEALFYAVDAAAHGEFAGQCYAS
ncbi:MAG: DUF3015 family protein [Pseudomonadota bacterium]